MIAASAGHVVAPGLPDGLIRMSHQTWTCGRELSLKLKAFSKVRLLILRQSRPLLTLI